jgi:hypothetical protein
MSLIKKIDVPTHLTARRARRRAEALLMSQSVAAGISEVKASGTKPDAQDFVEDFSLEHSSSSGPATPNARS